MVSLVNSVAYSNNRTRQKLNSLISDLSVRIRRWIGLECVQHISVSGQVVIHSVILTLGSIILLLARAFHIQLHTHLSVIRCHVLHVSIKDNILPTRRSIRRVLRSRSNRVADSTSPWGSWFPGTSPAPRRRPPRWQSPLEIPFQTAPWRSWALMRQTLMSRAEGQAPRAL